MNDSRLIAYIHGELNEEERQALLQELKTNSRLAEELRQLQELSSDIGEDMNNEFELALTEAQREKILNKNQRFLKIFPKRNPGVVRYILMLVIVVGIALIFRTEVRELIGGQLQQMSSAIQGFSQ